MTKPQRARTRARAKASRANARRAFRAYLKAARAAIADSESIPYNPSGLLIRVARDARAEAE